MSVARKDIIILLCVDNVNILITEKYIAIISLADNSGWSIDQTDVVND